MAIAIVEDGKPVLAKGYGVRKLGSPERVDADTIFPTGSTGKAITTAALAVLVDDGKLKWDDKIIDHMPWFRMYDPWVTNEMTVRDLLTHRSGLGLGRGRPDVRPEFLAQPRRHRARAALHQARDELPQRLRVRQPVVRRRRPVDRGSQRTDVGSVRARARAQACRHDEFGDRTVRALRQSEPRVAARTPRRSRAWPGRAGRARRTQDARRQRRAGGRALVERERHGALDAGAARPRHVDRCQRQADEGVLRSAVAADVDARDPHAHARHTRASSPRSRRSSPPTRWAGACATIAA